MRDKTEIANATYIDDISGLPRSNLSSVGMHMRVMI